MRPAARAYPTVRAPFTLGQVLGDTFRLYFANLIPVVLISIFSLLPLLALTLYASAHRQVQTPVQLASTILGALFLVYFICTPIATSAITYGVSQELRGREVAITDCLAVGLRSMLPVLGIAIVQGILIGLGYLACIIPGIVLQTMYAVTIPVALEEKPGIGGALSRSAQLTEGYRWTVFAAVVILGFVQSALNRLGFAFAFSGMDTKAPESANRAIPAFLVATSVTSLFSVGLLATLAAVLYYRLRSTKESIDVANLASIFD